MGCIVQKGKQALPAVENPAWAIGLESQGPASELSALTGQVLEGSACSKLEDESSPSGDFVVLVPTAPVLTGFFPWDDLFLITLLCTL